MGKTDTDKAWRERNRERYLASSRAACAKWREANRERERERGRTNFRADRDRRLKKKYGISLSDYAVLSEQQGGKCRICGGVNPDGKVLHVDHCHTTGVVRGLLCNSCNLALGMFKDDVSLLASAILYLEASREQVD